MGEANSRGSLADRRDAAILAGAEIIISLTAKDGKVSASFMPRDEEPNQDSHAVIFAGYLATNFSNLVKEAMQLYHAHKAAEAAAVGDARIITDRQPRPITDAAGNRISSTDDVNLVIPGPAFDSSVGEFSKRIEDGMRQEPWPFPKPEAVQSGGGGEFAGGGASASFDATPSSSEPDTAPSGQDGGNDGGGE